MSLYNIEDKKYTTDTVCETDVRFLMFFLNGIKGIGAVSIRNIVESYGNAAEVFELCEYISRAGDMCVEKLSSDIAEKKGIKISKQVLTEMGKAYADIGRIYNKYCLLADRKISYITHLDENYPERLRNIASAPACLFCLGRMPEDCIPSVAIVGARSIMLISLSTQFLKTSPYI